MTEFLSKGFKILRAISLNLPKSGLMNAEPAKIYKKKTGSEKKCKREAALRSNEHFFSSNAGLGRV